MLECGEDMNVGGQNTERINVDADPKQIEIDPQSRFTKGKDAEALVMDLNERDK